MYIKRMQKLPVAVLIDLDDTILSFSGVSEEAWESVCGDFAPRVGVGADDLRAAVARWARWFWSDPRREDWGRLDLMRARREITGRALNEVAPASVSLAVEMADAYASLRDALVHPFPGAIEALKRLREGGARLALVTNGAASPQRQKIERFELAPHFEAILIEGELGFGKPDARVFRQALEALDAAAADAWMVGNDLAADIAPAHALGLHTIWIDNAGDGLPKSAPVVPRRHVSSLAELLPAEGASPDA